MQVVQSHVTDYLLQNNIVIVRRFVFCEVVSEYCNFLVWTALTALYVPDELSSIISS